MRIEIKIPKDYMNIGISTDNKWIIGDTNDSTNWDTFKFPLPDGEWTIEDIKKDIVTIKSK